MQFIESLFFLCCSLVVLSAFLPTTMGFFLGSALFLARLILKIRDNQEKYREVKLSIVEKNYLLVVYIIMRC
jgi:hypothetical protein